MKTILFAGQGTQFKGMGKELFAQYPQLTRNASEILGYDIKKLCLEDPENKLGLTQYTQPAIYTVSALGFYRMTEKTSLSSDVNYVAGHSLGEYNALLAADVFSFETGLKLVQKRGALMGAASGGRMAAVIGASEENIKELLTAHQFNDIDIANVNTPTQFVIAGKTDSILQAEKIFTKSGIRYVPLNVSAPFHSRYMQGVQKMFALFLEDFTFKKPAFPVIANVTARPYDANAIHETLSAQISSPVLWTDSIKYLLERGEVDYIEVGSNILTRMVVEIKKAWERQEDSRKELAIAIPARAGNDVTGKKQNADPVVPRRNAQVLIDDIVNQSDGNQIPAGGLVSKHALSAK